MPAGRGRHMSQALPAGQQESQEFDVLPMGMIAGLQLLSLRAKGPL